MPATITLKAASGNLSGEEHTFDEPTTCVIGRARDCTIQLPSDEHHRAVSRHHCLIDINPPDVRIKDFGSLNGTFVNGRRIGGRGQGEQPRSTEVALGHGDEIGLGQTVFKILIHRPTVCDGCGAEIDNIPGSERLCKVCRRKKSPHQAVCTICGRDVKARIGERRGDFVCEECRQDPINLVNRILGEVGRGGEDLPMIRGYTIVRPLGRGGMGAVYLARNQLTGQEVALKVMLPQVAVDEKAKDLFLREARMTKALKHPNVVQLLDSDCSSGTFFFTLEFCNGGSVDQFMRREGRVLPVAKALDITLQALDGLDYAHNAPVTAKTEQGKFIRKKGIVHRDLKPANIFLSGTGDKLLAKIADLGLSKSFRAAGLTGMTATGSAAGSPWYMPRQQVIKYKYSKPEVDVWAMAASLYNMLTGAYPRQFPKGRDPWLAVLQDPVLPIRSRNSKIPRPLAEVIDEALVDQPEIRFKSAAKFKRALEKVL